jgi:PAS domain S-box-containing protein
LRSLLRSRPGWDVCGEASDGREAVEKAKELRPDVIVLDVSMPAMNGLEAARRIRSEVPQSEILILTQYESREMMHEAMSAGAKGYVVKSDISRDLLSAIEEVGQHRASFSSRMTATNSQPASVPESAIEEETPSLPMSPNNRLSYSSVAEAVPNLLFATDSEGKTTETNSRCAEYLGLGNEQKAGWCWTDFVHADDFERARAEHADSRGQQRVLEGEYRLRAADGSYRWHAVRMVPVREPNGIAAWIGSAIDVHDRRLASEELQQKEERLRIALEASDTGTFRWNPQTGEFLEFGPSLKRLFGFSDNDRILRTEDAVSRVHPEDVERVKSAIESCRQGADLEIQYRVVLPDGNIRWLYDRAKMVKDSTGRNASLIGACTDISRRKRAEEALQKAHDELDARVRLRTEELERKTAEVIEHARLLDLANDAIFVRNLDGVVFYWNEGAERLYGWSKNEIAFQPLSKLLQTEFPVPLPEILDSLRRTGTWEGELTHTRRDGTRIVVASRWTVWRSAQGEPIGWLQINTDITERRRVEDGLRAMSARLLHLQDEERRRIARELHDSAGQLLVALKLNLAMTENSLRDRGAEANKALNESLDLADQLSRELRTISHLLHPPLLDEAGLPSAVRWYVEGFAERSTIAVDLELAPDLGRLPRELETAIFRIVQECLTNIHRHSGSSMAAIRIRRTDDHLSVQVRDRGRGMPTSRRDGVAVPVRPGVGISGMRERVRQLGGRLEISSGRKGTVVTATFPLSNHAMAHGAGSTENAV